MTPEHPPERPTSEPEVGSEPRRPGRIVPVSATLAVLLSLLAAPLSLAAQGWKPEDRPVTGELLGEVVPGADRFGPKEGEPPVYRAFRALPDSSGERLVGYAFLTPDLPPDVVGYLGAIDVLVGMDPGGTITGVRVLGHREPLAHSRKGFFQEKGFLGQFAGKHVSDPFRLDTDIRGITGATISVDAMARGVRNAARRVAAAYLRASDEGLAGSGGRHAPLTAREVESTSWFDLVATRHVERLVGQVDGMVRIEIYFAELEDEAAAEALLGPRALERVFGRRGERRREGTTMMFLGLDAQNLAWFRPSMFFVVQDGDTLDVRAEDVVLSERLRGSRLEEQLGSAGIWWLDGRIDPSRPFTVGFGGEVGVKIATVTYGGPAGRPGRPTAVATEADEGPAAAASEAGPEAPAPAAGEPETRGEASVPVAEAGAADAAGAGVAPEAATESPSALDFATTVVEESQFRRTLERTSWSRVGGLLLLLALTSLAFSTRRTGLRWLTLGGTVLFLGFADRGFLSISHLTSAIVVGPDLFVKDLSLLLLSVFTLVTVLLWGRVFCGYLCPFGALQDVLDRLVPDRFQRRMPSWIHDRAIWIKYAILLLLLVPAAAEATGVAVPVLDAGMYVYFEPFGTVFFPATSVLLWTIAAVFLLASAVVPRFYCRYACPLGAALAVVSRISPFRIERVEQCTVCKVCEQDCPTGAIRGPEVDFPECVRCSVCEVNLREGEGTCRHDMEEIRPRLVQLRTSPGGEAAG